MSSNVISVTSSQHFKTIVASSTYVIVDFYADWCGPCKVISPIFEQLAAAESKPGRIQFAKVNVDNQRDVASTYGVSAMPTFLVLKGIKVVQTISGANSTALRTAVLSAAADATKGAPKQSAVFSSKGQTLGSGGASRSAARPASGPSFDFSSMLPSPASLQNGTLMATITRFFALYLTTLLSFDPVQAAEQSPFAVPKAPAGRTVR